MRFTLLGLVLVAGCGGSATSTPQRPVAEVRPVVDERTELDAIETLIGADRLAEAEELAAALVAKVYSADAFEARGRVRLFRGKTDEGLQDLRKAVAMAPREARFRIYLAEGFEHAERYDEAMGVARAALALEPRSGRVMRLLARLSRQRLELEEAQRWLRAAIDLDVDDGDAWLSLASVQHITGQLADAEASAARAVALRPDDPRAWHTYADILQRNGKLADAIFALEKAIATSRAGDAQLPQRYRRLSGAYAWSTQYEPAIVAMRRYLALTPSDAADRGEMLEHLKELEALHRDASQGRRPP